MTPEEFANGPMSDRCSCTGDDPDSFRSKCCCPTCSVALIAARDAEMRKLGAERMLKACQNHLQLVATWYPHDGAQLLRIQAEVIKVRHIPAAVAEGE